MKQPAPQHNSHRHRSAFALLGSVCIHLLLVGLLAHWELPWQRHTTPNATLRVNVLPTPKAPKKPPARRQKRNSQKRKLTKRTQRKRRRAKRKRRKRRRSKQKRRRAKRKRRKRRKRPSIPPRKRRRPTNRPTIPTKRRKLPPTRRITPVKRRVAPVKPTPRVNPRLIPGVRRTTPAQPRTPSPPTANPTVPKRTKPTPPGHLTPQQLAKARREIGGLFRKWNGEYQAKHRVRMANYAPFYRQVTRRLQKCWNPLKRQVRRLIQRQTHVLSLIANGPKIVTGTLKLTWHHTPQRVFVRWKFKHFGHKMTLYNIQRITKPCLLKLRPTRKTMRRKWSKVSARWRFRFRVGNAAPGLQVPPHMRYHNGLPSDNPNGSQGVGTVPITGIIKTLQVKTTLHVYPEAIFKTK